MATRLRPDSKLSRVIQVRGVDGPVIVTLTHEGLEMRVPGTQTTVTAEWHRVAESLRTPGNIPSYLEGRPLEVLKFKTKQRAGKG